MPSVAFARFWQVDLTRECFLSYLNQDDLQAMRLVSRDFADTIAPILFKEITVNFNATCFARQARIAALSRIGYHTRTFNFNMAHSDDTFLPPLLDPDTLDEVFFSYEPQIDQSRPSSSGNGAVVSKYGSWEMNDILIRQYPLLFHAATNVPSFIQAMKALPSIRHLRISCPNPKQLPTHRRDIVDYALISLRLAVEQSTPACLDTLSLEPIHSTATFYLRPQSTIGSSPSSTRVWRKIKNLNVIMDNPDVDYTRHDSCTDSLKSLHTYLTNFTSLVNFSFTWTGHKGANPLSLNSEPCTTQPSSLDYSTCAPLRPSSPPSLSSSPSSSCSSTASFSFASASYKSQAGLRTLRFRHLKSMRLTNSIFDAIQASDFILTHRKTLTEIQYESCHLRTGTWDDALEPLTKISGNDSWKCRQHDTLSTASTLVDETTPVQANTHPALRPRRPKLSIPIQTTSQRNNHVIMDVPIFLSPDEEISEMDFIKDRMWKPDSLAIFDDLDDRCSLANSSLSSTWSRRKKSMKTLRRIGEKLGLASYRINEEDIAMEGVRRLLRGGRVNW